MKKQLIFLIAGVIAIAAFVGAYLVAATMVEQGISAKGLLLLPYTITFAAAQKIMQKNDF